MKPNKQMTFNTLICVLIGCIFSAGCASTNSNGRRFKDTTSVHVVPLEPTIKTADFIGIAVEAAVAIAKFAIKAEAKNYEATSEASLLWTGGISASNPVMIAVIRTFEAKADFTTETIDQATNSILKEAKKRLVEFGFAIPAKQSEQFLTNIVRSHKADSKVSLVTLMLAYNGKDMSNVMYCPLVGYSYPVLKAKNSCMKVPFTKWHSTKSVLTLTVEGAQGYPNAAYKIQRVMGPKVLVWPRDEKDMSKWKPEKISNGAELLHQSPGIRSVPYQFPQGPVEITATLIESSDMKKTLESLGDAVGKLKLGDFKD